MEFILSKANVLEDDNSSFVIDYVFVNIRDNSPATAFCRGVAKRRLKRSEDGPATA